MPTGRCEEATGRGRNQVALILLEQRGQHGAQRRDDAVPPPDDVGNEAGPAGLVRGSEAGSGVAVEVLTEHQVVPPGRVIAQQPDLAGGRTVPFGAGREQRDKPVLEILSDATERALLAGADR